MHLSFLLCCWAALVPLLATAHTAVVFDVDFTAAPTNVIHRSGAGRFDGVLPEAVVDNFTSWAKAAVTTSLKSDAGGAFLRLETAHANAGAHFSIRTATPLTTGYYRVEAEARNGVRNRCKPLRLLARLGAPSWKGLWSSEFGGDAWTPQ